MVNFLDPGGPPTPAAPAVHNAPEFTLEDFDCAQFLVGSPADGDPSKSQFSSDIPRTPMEISMVPSTSDQEHLLASSSVRPVKAEHSGPYRVEISAPFGLAQAAAQPLAQTADFSLASRAGAVMDFGREQSVGSSGMSDFSFGRVRSGDSMTDEAHQASTSNLSGLQSYDQLPADMSNQFRLQRKAESARASRRRKKQYVVGLEQEVKRLGLIRYCDRVVK